MDMVLPQKFLFILDTNLAKANCTENLVSTSCDTVFFGFGLLLLNCVNFVLQFLRNMKLLLFQNISERLEGVPSSSEGPEENPFSDEPFFPPPADSLAVAPHPKSSITIGENLGSDIFCHKKHRFFFIRFILFA